MKIEHRTIKQDVYVRDNFTLHGMITGDVTVEGGGVLYLHGICSQNLTIETGGVAILHGVVSGNVYNRGGRLDVFGIIAGNLYKEAGNTALHRNSIVAGERVE